MTHNNLVEINSRSDSPNTTTDSTANSPVRSPKRYGQQSAIYQKRNYNGMKNWKVFRSDWSDQGFMDR